MAVRISRAITSTHAATAQSKAPATIQPAVYANQLIITLANDSSPTHARHAAISRISTFDGRNNLLKEHLLSIALPDAKHSFPYAMA